MRPKTFILIKFLPTVAQFALVIVCSLGSVPYTQAAESAGEDAAEGVRSAFFERNLGKPIVAVNNFYNKRLSTVFLFLHGLWMNSSQFDSEKMKLLTLPFDESLLVSMDLPGHGVFRNDRGTRYTDWQRAVTDALAVVREIAPHVILVGQSTGGLLALDAIQRRPDLVDGVIAIDPAIMVRPILGFGSWVAKMTMPNSDQWGPFPKLVVGSNVPSIDLGMGYEVEKLSKKFFGDLAKYSQSPVDSPGLALKEFALKFRGRLQVLGTSNDRVVVPGWIRLLQSEVRQGQALATESLSGLSVSHGSTEHLSQDFRVALCHLRHMTDRSGCREDEILMEVVSKFVDGSESLDPKIMRKGGYVKFLRGHGNEQISIEMVSNLAVRLLSKEDAKVLIQGLEFQKQAFREWNLFVTEQAGNFSIQAEEIVLKTTNEIRTPIIISNSVRQLPLWERLSQHCSQLEGFFSDRELARAYRNKDCVIMIPSAPSKNDVIGLQNWENGLNDRRYQFAISSGDITELCKLALHNDSCIIDLARLNQMLDDLQTLSMRFKLRLLEDFAKRSEATAYKAVQGDIYRIFEYLIKKKQTT